MKIIPSCIGLHRLRHCTLLSLRRFLPPIAKRKEMTRPRLRIYPRNLLSMKPTFSKKMSRGEIDTLLEKLPAGDTIHHAYCDIPVNRKDATFRRTIYPATGKLTAAKSPDRD